MNLIAIEQYDIPEKPIHLIISGVTYHVDNLTNYKLAIKDISSKFGTMYDRYKWEWQRNGTLAIPSVYDISKEIEEVMIVLYTKGNESMRPSSGGLTFMRRSDSLVTIFFGGYSYGSYKNQPVEKLWYSIQTEGYFRFDYLQ
jgi:hypothetical protein